MLQPGSSFAGVPITSPTGLADPDDHNIQLLLRAILYACGRRRLPVAVHGLIGNTTDDDRPEDMLCGCDR
jgi:hypothetical protein